MAIPTRSQYFITQYGFDPEPVEVPRPSSPELRDTPREDLVSMIKGLRNKVDKYEDELKSELSEKLRQARMLNCIEMHLDILPSLSEGGHQVLALDHASTWLDKYGLENGEGLLLGVNSMHRKIITARLRQVMNSCQLCDTRPACKHVLTSRPTTMTPAQKLSFEHVALGLPVRDFLATFSNGIQNDEEIWSRMGRTLRKMARSIPDYREQSFLTTYFRSQLLPAFQGERLQMLTDFQREGHRKKDQKICKHVPQSNIRRTINRVKKALADGEGRNTAVASRRQPGMIPRPARSSVIGLAYGNPSTAAIPMMADAVSLPSMTTAGANVKANSHHDRTRHRDDAKPGPSRRHHVQEGESSKQGASRNQRHAAVSTAVHEGPSLGRTRTRATSKPRPNVEVSPVSPHGDRHPRKEVSPLVSPRAAAPPSQVAHRLHPSARPSSGVFGPASPPTVNRTNSSVITRWPGPGNTTSVRAEPQAQPRQVRPDPRRDTVVSSVYSQAGPAVPHPPVTPSTVVPPSRRNREAREGSVVQNQRSPASTVVPRGVDLSSAAGGVLGRGFTNSPAPTVPRGTDLASYAGGAIPRHRPAGAAPTRTPTVPRDTDLASYAGGAIPRHGLAGAGPTPTLTVPHGVDLGTLAGNHAIPPTQATTSRRQHGTASGHGGPQTPPSPANTTSSTSSNLRRKPAASPLAPNPLNPRPAPVHADTRESWTSKITASTTTVAPPRRQDPVPARQPQPAPAAEPEHRGRSRRHRPTNENRLRELQEERSHTIEGSSRGSGSGRTRRQTPPTSNPGPAPLTSANLAAIAGPRPIYRPSRFLEHIEEEAKAVEAAGRTRSPSLDPVCMTTRDPEWYGPLPRGPGGPVPRVSYETLAGTYRMTAWADWYEGSDTLKKMEEEGREEREERNTRWKKEREEIERRRKEKGKGKEVDRRR